MLKFTCLSLRFDPVLRLTSLRALPEAFGQRMQVFFPWLPDSDVRLGLGSLWRTGLGCGSNSYLIFWGRLTSPGQGESCHPRYACMPHFSFIAGGFFQERSHTRFPCLVCTCQQCGQDSNLTGKSRVRGKGLHSETTAQTCARQHGALTSPSPLPAASLNT